MKKITLKKRLTNLIDNNLLLLAIWMVVVFLGSIVSIYEGWKFINDTYSNTVGLKESEMKKLSTISTNIHIDNYLDKFGKPTIIKTINNLDLKIYIFSNKYYYLDLVTNKDGVVKLFGVVSRNTEFNPRFTTPESTKENPMEVILNETTLFGVHPNTPSNHPKNNEAYALGHTCSGYLGVRRFGLYELIYLSNPGRYQSIVIGINDAGDISNAGNVIDLLHAFNNSNADIDCSKLTEGLRKAIIINSYRESAPFFDLDIYATQSAEILSGVDYDELRAIE